MCRIPRILGAVAAAALLAACGSGAVIPVATQGGQGGMGQGGQGGGGGISPTLLNGTWLGPMPGDTGACGTSVGEYVFQGSTWSFTSQSNDCGGFTFAGDYQLSAGTVAFHMTTSTCPTCTVPPDFSVTVKMIDSNSLQMCDQGPGGRCYTYHRQ